MASGNWSEAGVRVRKDGTVEPGHNWRVREVPGGDHWRLLVHKTEARMWVECGDGTRCPVTPELSIREGDLSFHWLRLIVRHIGTDRDGVVLLAHDTDTGDWMAAVSVYAFDGSKWRGCDAVVADVALGLLASEMADRDPDVWPAMRAGLATAMAATTRGG